MPRALIIFWVAVAAVVGLGIGVLQYLGPPPAPHPVVAAAGAPKLVTAASSPKPPAVVSVPKPPVAVVPPKPAVAVTPPKPAIAAAAPKSAASLAQSVPSVAALGGSMGTGSLLQAGAPIPAPIAALLTAAPSNPNLAVPRIGPSGLTPMQAYAAAVPAASGPKVAILVAGIGDDDALSQEVITNLPAAVSLALTPYGQHIADIAALARAAGHEILLELPMQELNPATENAGNEALVVAGPITLDQPMLDWNMAQLQGYAGVTDAIGVTQGAGFMNNGNAKSWLLQELADKGLFFIDARPVGMIPYAWGRNADVIIDTVNAPQNEAALLADLASQAKMQNAALGVLLNPAPNALEMLSTWVTSLPGQGITLVPVSALVLPPNAPVAELAPAAPLAPVASPPATAASP